MMRNRTYLLHNSEMKPAIYTISPAGFRHQVTLIITEIPVMLADRCPMVAEMPLESRHDTVMVEGMMSKALEKSRSGTEAFHGAPR
jgi:hypothetical protein